MKTLFNFLLIISLFVTSTAYGQLYNEGDIVATAGFSLSQKGEIGFNLQIPVAQIGNKVMLFGGLQYSAPTKDAENAKPSISPMVSTLIGKKIKWGLKRDIRWGVSLSLNKAEFILCDVDHWTALKVGISKEGNSSLGISMYLPY